VSGGPLSQASQKTKLRVMRMILPLITALAAPISAVAHPHVFVEATVTVIFDELGDVAIKLDWLYDDLFSLLVTSDLGLDMDGDLILTAAEQTMLDDQVAAWPPEYQGDLDVSQNGEAVALLEKQGHSMSYTGGLFREVHLRPVSIADPAAPLQIRVYDPSFYTAYDLKQPVLIEGRDDCDVSVIPADLDAAYALAESLNVDLSSQSSDPNDYFPAIGDAFADTIVVTCAGPL